MLASTMCGGVVSLDLVQCTELCGANHVPHVNES